MMIKLTVFASLAGFGMLAMSSPAVADSLGQYQWTHRPLVIIAPPGSELLKKQSGVLARHRGGFIERNMAVLVVNRDGVRTLLGPQFRGADRALRARFGSRPRVLLIGKDGGVKLASTEVVSARQLFGLIDSMPMRQQEMRRGGG